MEYKKVDTTANRLRIALEKAGKKQADLVRETGIDKGSMSHYLKGKYEPKSDVVFNLAKALDVSEMWLWGYDCDIKRPIAQKNNDTIADIVVRLRTDIEFLELVRTLADLDKEKVASAKQFLNTFLK